MTTVPIDEVEASKAPLMDHLIELRSRLIKAVAAFMVAFVVCFYFSKHIYNILVFPFVDVVGAANAELIATHFLEQFFTNMKLSMFGAAGIAFPIIATQIYMFVAPGLYKHEKRAFLPYLVATPLFFIQVAPVSSNSPTSTRAGRPAGIAPFAAPPATTASLVKPASPS